MNPTTRIRTLAFVLAVAALAGGCVAAPLERLNPLAQRRLTSEQSAALRRDLDAFETEARAVVEAAADRIFRSAVSSSVQRSALMLKTRVLDQLDHRLEEPDPYVAAVDAWIHCIRVTRHLESPQGEMLFNIDRTVALDAMRTVTHRIATILANPQYTTRDVYAKLRTGVQTYAAQHPLIDEFRETQRATSRLDRGFLGGLEDLLGIPLAPFRAVEEVKGGMDEFTKTVGELPKEFRWEAELLVLSVEKSQATQSALRSLDRLSRGVYDLGRSAELMPQTIQTTLDAVDKNKTVAAAMTELKQIGDGAAAVGKAAEVLPVTIRQTVDASLKTASTTVDENKSVRSALDSFARISRSMENFVRTTDALPGEMEQSVARVIQSATQQSFPMIDYIGWWIAKLLGAAAAAVAGLIVLTRLLRPRRADRESKGEHESHE